MPPSKTKTAAPKKAVAPQRIMQFSWGFGPPLILEAAIRNNLFNTLDRGPKTLVELTKATGASARGVRAIADALVAMGLLKRRGEKYSLAPEAAAFLVSGKPSFLGGMAVHVSKSIIPNWLKLADIVKTGKPALGVNQAEAGSKFFAGFVEDLFNMNHPAASAAADALLAKVSAPTSVLDVAAGSGVWGIAMAEKSRHVRVTAVDWPDVLKVTREVAAKHKVADRFSYFAGDMQKVDLGSGYRVATLGHILHSEGEARSRKLLKRVFAALASGGTIVIGEFLVDENRAGPPNSLIFAVNMLVNTDEGGTFTFGEIKGWLQETGFRKVRKLDCQGPSPLILADKP